MENILMAVIAGIATIVASVVTIFLKNYLETIRYKNLDKYIIEDINGNWRGEFEQVLRGKFKRFVVDIELKVEKSGKIIGSARSASDELNFKLELKGGFYSERFLRIDYQNSKKSILQF